MEFKILIVLCLFSKTLGMIAYDCGTERTNVATISLLDVEECNAPVPIVNETQKYIQLLQINEFIETKVIQCKIEIHRTMYYCGMHSHVSIVENGVADYIKEISPRACSDAHEVGILSLGYGKIVDGLKVNSTITHSITLAGSLTNEGDCEGTTYYDPYGHGKNLVVQGTVKITLMSYSARVNLNTNQVYLRSGVICGLSEAACLDHEGGQTFWTPIPYDKCKFNQYGVLYEGFASKLEDPTNEEQKVIYSVNTKGTTFALSVKGMESVCGINFFRTEHPKLVIFETHKGNTFINQQEISVANLDLFAYMNSKLVYVEKYIRQQMKLLYHDVILQKCLLERETLKNTQALVYVAPDRFAYNYMNGPGYMAVTAGEVVHLIKCTPVEVKMEHGTYCYGEMQVQRNNITYFMTPITRILKTIGTRNECNPLLPPIFQIGNSWFQLLPKPSHVTAPAKMKPSARMTWKYVNPSDLATSGIYTEKDLETLRNKMMYPLEKPSLLNNMAREIEGLATEQNESMINKFLSEHTLKKLLDSAWKKFWGRFVVFGSVSAGFIAIYVIYGFVKAAISFTLRLFTLHGTYGCSYYLMGAIWGALTQLLIHLGQRAARHQPKDEEANNPPLVLTNQPAIEEPTAPVYPSINNIDAANSINAGFFRA